MISIVCRTLYALAVVALVGGTCWASGGIKSGRDHVGRRGRDRAPRGAAAIANLIRRLLRRRVWISRPAHAGPLCGARRAPRSPRSRKRFRRDRRVDRPLQPDQGEEERAEQLIGVDIPSPDEMVEIEASSRLYSENNALYMTATLLVAGSSSMAQSAPVSFILTHERLTSIRYAEPSIFRTFVEQAKKADSNLEDADSVFIALIEAVIDRTADILEKAGAEIDAVSLAIFQNEMESGTASQRLQGSSPSARAKRRPQFESAGEPGQHRPAGRISSRRNAATCTRACANGRDHVRRHSLARRPRDLYCRHHDIPARRAARPDQHRAERYHQDRLGGVGADHAAHARRQHLRDEFPFHAGAQLAVRLSAGALRHDRCRPPLLLFQAARLVLAGRAALPVVAAKPGQADFGTIPGCAGRVAVDFLPQSVLTYGSVGADGASDLVYSPMGGLVCISITS